MYTITFPAGGSLSSPDAAQVIDHAQGKINQLARELDRLLAELSAETEKNKALAVTAGKVVLERDELRARLLVRESTAPCGSAVRELMEAADALDKAVNGTAIHGISTKGVDFAKRVVAAKATVQSAIHAVRTELQEPAPGEGTPHDLKAWPPGVEISAGDWQEDASHENGNYHCKCLVCGKIFTGHKRRVACKVCAKTATQVGPAPTQPHHYLVHSLKCHPEPFQAMARGEKHHEFRRNDRGFKVGDQLHLQEWDFNTGKYTGSEIRRTVTYVGTDFGIPEGFCCMSVSK